MMFNLVFWIGAIDAVLIVACGIVAAFLTMTGKDAEVFWSRVLPATLILVATSVAAGVVMAVTRWIGG